MKILKKIKACIAGLLVLGVACASSSVLTSCVSTETATVQITNQTQDPVAIAKAAYLDALKLYNDLGERYLKYIPYMERNYPQAHYEIMYIFQEMDKMLIMWEGFAQAGIIPERAPQHLQDYADAIIALLFELDAALEAGQLEI